ncbi:hypothetical protein EJB05_30375, partial [Eragrostis curvula]
LVALHVSQVGDPREDAYSPESPLPRRQHIPVQSHHPKGPTRPPETRERECSWFFRPAGRRLDLPDPLYSTPPHDMFGAWSAQTSGSSPSCPGAGFGPPTGLAPWGRLSEKGSRVSPYMKTAEDSQNKGAGFYNGYIESISAMPIYGNKSHEELRYEDYQIQDKGGASLHKNPFNPSPMVPVSSPPSMEQPSTVLQPSTQGPNCSPNPFWLPSARLQSPISSVHLQSSKQGPCASTSSLSFSFPVRSMGVQTLPFVPIASNQPQSEFQKSSSSYSPSSLAIPCTAHGGSLVGTETHTGSATTSSTMTKATFWHTVPISTSPTARQENVFSNSAAAHATPADATSTPSIFSQKGSTTSTHSGTSSSAAHSEPSNSLDAHCTNINVDYPNNAIELLLPADISLVKIRFSSQACILNLSTKLCSMIKWESVHSDRVATASETPISLSLYPGENEELIIQSIERPPHNQRGKQCRSTAGSCPNDESDCSKVCNTAACPQSSSDVRLAPKSVTAPACEVVSGSVLPRLYNSDYYTVPSIVELAVRESDEPGYCSRVQDFTVGRHGYGSVKFYGETDVRKLDITSILEFNDREILVYRDESKAPPVGQELNKPAEVTLLNVKCFDQKTGQQFTMGPAVDRYTQVLVQWTKEHDAEFISFNAVKGEWKFKVKNFSQ